MSVPYYPMGRRRLFEETEPQNLLTNLPVTLLWMYSYLPLLLLLGVAALSMSSGQFSKLGVYWLVVVIGMILRNILYSSPALASMRSGVNGQTSSESGLNNLPMTNMFRAGYATFNNSTVGAFIFGLTFMYLLVPTQFENWWGTMLLLIVAAGDLLVRSIMNRNNFSLMDALGNLVGGSMVGLAFVAIWYAVGWEDTLLFREELQTRSGAAPGKVR